MGAKVLQDKGKVTMAIAKTYAQSDFDRLMVNVDIKEDKWIIFYHKAVDIGVAPGRL